ncbi:MAG TPA: right-handed parallel beta-helix repeat-containing protein [Myxococcales bacterium]|jgi:hypothetical protein
MRIALWLVAALWSGTAVAAEVTADPSTLNQKLSTLQPGDTLRLAAGTYQHFTVANLNGSEAAWIAITGPESGAPAIVEANDCCNTVEIDHSSYVAIRNLTIDGKDNGGSFGVSAKGLANNLVHHVRVERNTFTHHAGGQQQVAISTKTTTWGWEIRENRILDAGTGLYLGNSDGTQPFIRGVIERNLVQDPVGYCLQVKYQKPWPALAGLPTGDGTTVIRHNVFIKNDAASPDGDRPNLLVGGFPDSGPGANDRYEIYGNLFFHNPRESLLQASGRVSIHDNLFVDAAASAVLLQNHDLPLKQAHVYNNTIYSAATGISFASAAAQGSAAVGNVVFAATPIGGTPADSRDNVTGTAGQAAEFLVSPTLVLGTLDLYPLSGKCTGTALDLTAFAGDADLDRDFNGTSKGAQTWRGAYAGDGTNPGWKVAADLKPESAVPVTPPDAGAVDAAARPSADSGSVALPDAAATTSGDAGAGARQDGGASPGVTDGGCGCATAGAPLGLVGLAAGLLGALKRRKA